MDDEALIQYKNVEIHQQELCVLSDVNLELHKGEFVYLIGKVGSGKTSLLKTLYGELDVIDGEAEVLGYNMRSIKRKHIPQLRRKLGIVFQDFQLLTDRTVYNNLEFVLRATGWKNTAEMEVLTRDSAALEEELRAISGSDDTFLETRTRLADELSDLKLKALAAQKDIESHRAAIAQLESRTDESDARARQLAANIETLTAQNAERAAQIETIRAAIAGSRNEIEKREEAKAGAVRRRMEKEGGITQQTARVRKITDEREALGREIARLTEQKEQKDAEYEQTVAKLWEEYELTLSAAQELCVPFESGAELRRQVSEVRGKIKALGNVNVSAIEEYAEVSQRYEFLRAQVGDVETSKAELQKLIAGLSDEMRAMFSESFAAINRNFGRIFAELFGGGTARLYLEDEADVLGSGISIEVAPPGKIIRNLSALSGGEQALVAISIYFAIFGVNPAPFCVLDEIEAALDDVNVTRFAQYLRRISSETQFIVITHRRGTMEEADVLYGVTMQEDGVSKVLKLDLEHVDASLVS